MLYVDNLASQILLAFSKHWGLYAASDLFCDANFLSIMRLVQSFNYQSSDWSGYAILGIRDRSKPAIKS